MASVRELTCDEFAKVAAREFRRDDELRSLAVDAFRSARREGGGIPLAESPAGPRGIQFAPCISLGHGWNFQTFHSAIAGGEAPARKRGGSSQTARTKS